MPTLTGIRTLYAEAADDGLIVLVTLEAPGWSAPVRLAATDQPVVSRGYAWTPWPIEVVLPEISRDGIQPGRLILDATVRDVVSLVRGLSGPIAITIEAVLASAPDVVEIGPIDLSIDTVSGSRQGDTEVLEAPLVIADRLDERYPADIFTPATFAGLVA